MLYPFFDPVSKNTFLTQAEIDRKRSVNGEKTLTGTICLSDELIDKIDKRWAIKFGNETYIIDYAKQMDQGNRKILDFDATHEFFDVFTKKQIYEEYNGSHTFKWYLDTLFKDTGYSYNLSVDVDALEKENWGLTNRMSLFADLITTAGLEYEINGKIINIKKEIGSDLSTIVRKGFNLQDLNIESDFSNFITYMEGFGAFKDPEDQSKGRLHVTYKSPLADTYGILEGEPKVDERFTVEENLLENIKNTVDNSIAISLDMTLEDLQSVGYDYAMAQPGDTIMVINEVMDFRQKVRIIETTESFNIAGIKIGTDVTCGSLSITDKQQAADAETSSLIDRIANGKDKIPPSWLTDFIVQNSEALNNARSELKFTEQGIVAQEKNNANNLVILNSAGLGISTNGGKTYENAITAQGINASAIVTGILKSINIEGVKITGSEGYFDVLYSSFLPKPPFPQYREEIKMGGGDGFRLQATRVGKSYPALRMRMNTTGDLGYAIEAVNENNGNVHGDMVVRISPFAGIETPLLQSDGWCYVGANADGRIACIDRRTWKSGGGPQIVYIPIRAKAFETASTSEIKTDIHRFNKRKFVGKTAKEIIEQTNVYSYYFDDDGEEKRRRIGFIAEQAAKELQTVDGKAIDLYQAIAVIFKYVKEQNTEIEQLKKELEEVRVDAAKNY